MYSLGTAQDASFMFLALFRHTVSTRSQSVRGASHQPLFMGSCLTINHKCLCPVYLVHKLENFIVQPGGEGGGAVVVSSTPDLQVVLCSVVCVDGLWMIKLMVAWV